MSVSPLSVEDEVDLWKMQRLTHLGFDGTEIACLLFWGTSPHDVERLLYRDGRRTPCTHAQAIRIARPIELAPGLPAKFPMCVVCDDAGCEMCPKVA